MRTDEKQGQSYILTGQKATFPQIFQLDKCVDLREAYWSW